MRMKYDWLMEKHKKMGEWRFAKVDYGAQCVMKIGISEILW